MRAVVMPRTMLRMGQIPKESKHCWIIHPVIVVAGCLIHRSSKHVEPFGLYPSILKMLCFGHFNVAAGAKAHTL